MEHKRYIKQTIAFLSLLLLSYCSKELFAQTKNSATYLEYLKQGSSKDELQNYTGAIQDYTKAIFTDPKAPQAYIFRGLSKFFLQDYTGAIQDFEIAKKLGIGENVFPFLHCGLCKFHLGDFTGAIQDFNEAIFKDPKDGLAYSKRGISKCNLGDYWGAIQDNTKAIGMGYEDSDNYCYRAFAKSRLKDYTGAIGDCTQAIVLNPKNGYAHYLRGLTNLLIYQKKYVGCVDLSKAGELGYKEAYDIINKHCN